MSYLMYCFSALMEAGCIWFSIALLIFAFFCCMYEVSSVTRNKKTGMYVTAI